MKLDFDLNKEYGDWDQMYNYYLDNPDDEVEECTLKEMKKIVDWLAYRIMNPDAPILPAELIHPEPNIRKYAKQIKKQQSQSQPKDPQP